MIPLYFPFTFVRAAAAEWLAATFETLCLLVPSAAHEGRCLAAGVDPGPWRVLFPPRDRDDDLARLETEMRQWADLHAGADLGALYAARPRDLPFWGAPSISRLRQRIRTGEKDAGAGADVDPLMAARVFLSFAHGHGPGGIETQFSGRFAHGRYALRLRWIAVRSMPEPSSQGHGDMLAPAVPAGAAHQRTLVRRRHGRLHPGFDARTFPDARASDPSAATIVKGQ